MTSQKDFDMDDRQFRNPTQHFAPFHRTLQPYLVELVCLNCDKAISESLKKYGSNNEPYDDALALITSRHQRGLKLKKTNERAMRNLRRQKSTNYSPPTRMTRSKSKSVEEETGKRKSRNFEFKSPKISKKHKDDHYDDDMASPDVPLSKYHSLQQQLQTALKQVEELSGKLSQQAVTNEPRVEYSCCSSETQLKRIKALWEVIKFLCAGEDLNDSQQETVEMNAQKLEDFSDHDMKNLPGSEEHMAVHVDTNITSLLHDVLAEHSHYIHPLLLELTKDPITGKSAPFFPYPEDLTTAVFQSNVQQRMLPGGGRKFSQHLFATLKPIEEVLGISLAAPTKDVEAAVRELTIQWKHSLDISTYSDGTTTGAIVNLPQVMSVTLTDPYIRSALKLDSPITTQPNIPLLVNFQYDQASSGITSLLSNYPQYQESALAIENMQLLGLIDGDDDGASLDLVNFRNQVDNLQTHGIIDPITKRHVPVTLEATPDGKTRRSAGGSLSCMSDKSSPTSIEMTYDRKKNYKLFGPVEKTVEMVDVLVKKYSVAERKQYGVGQRNAFGIPPHLIHVAPYHRLLNNGQTDMKLIGLMLIQLNNFDQFKSHLKECHGINVVAYMSRKQPELVIKVNSRRCGDKFRLFHSLGPQMYGIGSECCHAVGREKAIVTDPELVPLLEALTCSWDSDIDRIECSLKKEDVMRAGNVRQWSADSVAHIAATHQLLTLKRVALRVEFFGPKAFPDTVRECLDIQSGQIHWLLKNECMPGWISEVLIEMFHPKVQSQVVRATGGNPLITGEERKAARLSEALARVHQWHSKFTLSDFPVIEEVVDDAEADVECDDDEMSDRESIVDEGNILAEMSDEEDGDGDEVEGGGMKKLQTAFELSRVNFRKTSVEGRGGHGSTQKTGIALRIWKRQNCIILEIGTAKNGKKLVLVDYVQYRVKFANLCQLWNFKSRREFKLVIDLCVPLTFETENNQWVKVKEVGKKAVLMSETLHPLYGPSWGELESTLRLDCIVSEHDQENMADFFSALEIGSPRLSECINPQEKMTPLSHLEPQPKKYEENEKTQSSSSINFPIVLAMKDKEKMKGLINKMEEINKWDVNTKLRTCLVCQKTLSSVEIVTEHHLIHVKDKCLTAKKQHSILTGTEFV